MSASDNFNARIGRFVDTKQVQSIRDSYKANLAQIRQNTMLSPEGKKVEVAKAHVHAARQMNEYKEQFKGAVAAERGRIQRRLFGPGTADPLEVTNHRDALSRATSLTNEQDALELLRWADISGDTALGRAVMYQAYQKNWSEAIDTHDRAHPGTADGMKELDTLPEGPQTEAFAFGLGTPEEFGSFTIGQSADHEIEQWAERE